ncbi:MAG: fatty acid oxidation complex subunit alpha FadB [Deltaproteobacteria bacterium]|nr:fatty acid oxidation complex subunit alpha FadB [Deltaproteobacteria bacterium]
MLYNGSKLTLAITDGVAELTFNNQDESVNKFDRATLAELRAAVDALKGAEGVRGLVAQSAKRDFIVGADITEFGALFAGTEAELIGWMEQANAIFNDLEDLPFPSVSTVTGNALGGGFEMALSTDYRLIADKATVGLPEIKLGICPGFGGTVRLPRLVGADNAIEVIAAGKTLKAEEALKMGAVDGVLPAEKLAGAARALLAQAAAGAFDWRARRAQKTSPLKLGMMEQMMCFTTAKGFIAGQAGKDYPAPLEVVKAIEKAAGKDRAGALKAEAQAFAKLAKTSVADSLIALFLNDQLIKKKSKAYAGQARAVKQAAVLGAGIMGGGIAYQSASKGTPILMKDIREEALALGLSEANKLLAKQVERGKVTSADMGATLGRIRPTLSYGDFGAVDVVVEAVVENEKVKKLVLAEVERAAPAGAIIASNTSSISITRLAEALARPENFCGMHFFNPVHMMPLVEVIRGAQSSPEAIATTVDYATKMGKTAIVVGDCPGFFVNRVLFPYFAGFQLLVREGVDFKRIDKLMEGFGWPMGPAYLLDVVGIDTAHHVGEVLADGFPDRMRFEGSSSLDALYEAKRFGQKNNLGYYSYTLDKKGKPAKAADDAVGALLAPVQAPSGREVSDQEIIDRVMIPMIIETARCLEEGIVETPAEADMGLIMGIGFPPFRGGALKYADAVGMAAVCAQAERFVHLGRLYEPTPRMREMAAGGLKYHG